MRNIAGFALTTASAFLAVVAIMLNAPSLFYMGTALIATLGACQLQAWLSVRALRFERIAPESVRVGELVTVEVIVWSLQKIRRPLITVLDDLPPKLMVGERSPSLPIAPAYDLPIRTQYQFRPLRRGHFKWSKLTVEGTDALGLVTKRRTFETDRAEITVLPRPIPVAVDLPMAAGWGISEAESGQTRGAGIEPRGVRAYSYGDSLRHVHWRSSAKTGQLLVKEFEAGTHAAAAFLIQTSLGSEIGTGANTSLELICGNVAYLAEQFLRQGARVDFPGLEQKSSFASPLERLNEIYEILASVQANQSQNLGETALAVLGILPTGSALMIAMTLADDSLIEAVAQLSSRGTQVVPLLYDALNFLPKNAKRIPRSAADPLFIEQLRSAGAFPVVMPTEGTVEQS